VGKQADPPRQKALVWILRDGLQGPEALLLERTARRGGGFHPVTGKVERGESLREAAAREAEEETGLTGPLTELDHRYEYAGKHGALFVEHAFLLRAPTGSEPRLSGEHSAHRWVPALEADALLEWATHRETLRLAIGAWNGKA
jgi:lipoyl(octanoyl) transferase